MRLHARGVIDLGKFVRGVLDEYTAALLYHVFDDTPDGSCKRHAHLVAMWDPELQSPRFLFLSCKGTPDKSAEGNAAENMLNTTVLGDVDADRHGGCCCDHAALSETSTFMSLMSTAAARQREEVVRSKGIIENGAAFRFPSAPTWGAPAFAPAPAHARASHAFPHALPHARRGAIPGLG